MWVKEGETRCDMTVQDSAREGLGSECSNSDNCGPELEYVCELSVCSREEGELIGIDCGRRCPGSWCPPEDIDSDTGLAVLTGDLGDSERFTPVIVGLGAEGLGTDPFDTGEPKKF